MLDLIDDAGLTDMVEPAGGLLGIVRNGQVHRFQNYRELLAGGLLGERSQIAFREMRDDAHNYHDQLD
ncbi:MAG TPA: hypothetical protein VHU91_04335 [Mycobacteriales bacterium]|jgi:hypothetical protein|nr:hypothetical protein [Mycobacteriales bacterium]